MTFPVVPLPSIKLPTKSQEDYWPLAKLKVDEAFVIPITDNCDEFGRKTLTLRTRLCALAKKHEIKLSIRKTADGHLAVIRIQ